MPSYFFDSSAIVKYYHPEAGSNVVNQLLEAEDSRFYIARLAVVEVQRALAGKARVKLIDPSELQELRGQFYADLRIRRFRVKKLNTFHFHSAVRLVNRYGPEDATPNLYSLDALHLAVALDIRTRDGLDTFVSADKDLCAVAEAEQLSVLNPEQP